MDQFYVCSDILGTDNLGLFVSQDGFTFLGRRPKDCWIVGKRAPNEFSLDDALQLENNQVRLSPPEKFSKTIIGIPKGHRAKWPEMLPKREFKSFINDLIKNIQESFHKNDFRYYLNTWSKITPIFSSFKRMAKVDSAIFQAEVDASSFKPVNGFCESINYNRFGTRTGRLTITSGPQILTLKRDLRKFLRSRWGDNGVLLSFDFSALEVRLLTSDNTGSVSQEDPYLDLSFALNGELNRERAKLALISTVYGATVQGLMKSLLVSQKDAQKIHDVITQRYGVDLLVKKLRSEFTMNGYIRNRYFRKVEVPDPGDGQLLNSYLQSSGVDVALLGFLEIINRLNPDWAIPVAVLHDALILDVSKEFASKIGSTLKVSVPGYDGKFPLKISEFNV